MTLRIVVFLPMSTTVSKARRLMRIDCICFEPTLSQPTMKAALYFSMYLPSLAPYSFFFSLTGILCAAEWCLGWGAGRGRGTRRVERTAPTSTGRGMGGCE